ncbi:MAG: SDR family oxidoreductase [Aphanocapsa sp. GSE-SYN-MK-11-07L]|nr:SDR family oxidoreductase [Aphanocapsa sp. GSE-SYN-MK-11-07L]
MTLLSKSQALITGASSGIGKATALACAEAGIDLVLLGRSLAKLEAVAAAAQALGVKAKPYVIDLAEVDQVREQVAAIAAESGPIDILINNAGSGYTAELIQMPLADWQALLNLNLTSVLLCTQALLPQMRERHCGTIVNVVSIAGRQVFPEWGAYCVSKFGLMAFSKTLAAEERSHGIRVVTLCPGAVDTALWDRENVQADFDRQSMLSPASVAQSILYALKLPSEAVVEELVLMPSGGAF